MTQQPRLIRALTPRPPARIVCHYSAEASDARAVAEGDWVKMCVCVSAAASFACYAC